jgi:hypothetical protein
MALYSNTSGTNNAALGYKALKSNTLGTNNLAIGYQVASTTLTTGSNNILIGTSNAVDTPAAGTNNFLSIGNAIYGTGVGTGSDLIGIKTNSPQATLDVNGYMRLATNVAQPVACAAGNKGSIAYTGTTTNYLCFCDGTGWMQAHSPGTACAW